MACVGALVAASSLVFAGGAAAAGGRRAYTCAGGVIPSGTYASIIVAGPCSVAADAVIDVTGSVRVLPGAMLDAQSAPATITVGRNVTSEPGSMVGLGCQPPEYTHNSGHTCETDPEGHSTIVVKEVMGNVNVLGGGSDIPWSIKNDTIHGNLTVAGQTEEWIGILFNTIDGNVTLAAIRLTGLNDDTGSGTNPLFVVRNSIGRNIACFGLRPGVTGYGNTISRHALGQCAPLADG